MALYTYNGTLLYPLTADPDCCCDTTNECCPCCEQAVPDAYDITLVGFSNANCVDCTNINGTHTVCRTEGLCGGCTTIAGLSCTPTTEFTSVQLRWSLNQFGDSCRLLVSVILSDPDDACILDPFAIGWALYQDCPDCNLFTMPVKTRDNWLDSLCDPGTVVQAAAAACP